MTNEELQIAVKELQNEVKTLQEIITLTYRQKLRLDNALQGSKIYYVVPGATGPTGPSSQKLTFKDGILTSEI